MKERLTLKAAGLCHTQQNKVCLCVLLTELAGNLSLYSEVPKGPLGCIVLPQNAIDLNEGEQTVSEPGEPLLVLLYCLSAVARAIDGILIELIDASSRGDES
ncbi:MAG: hypothetical protein ACI9DF_000169 [Verrucomicrobiales bacterium]